MYILLILSLIISPSWTFLPHCTQTTNTQECLPQSHNMASLWNLPSLSRYYFLSLLSILNLIFLNYVLRPPLAGLPPSPTRLSTFCPCVNISHCCCRWCVMRETERSLCARSVGAAVCDFLPCGVLWQACGCWRQPADCPSVCLSVRLHLTCADIAVPAHMCVTTYRS